MGGTAVPERRKSKAVRNPESKASDVSFGESNNVQEKKNPLSDNTSAWHQVALPSAVIIH